ncbi:MAG: YfhO family protein [Eubacterium sp.]|nr:YfhO family protein [Eubacterium sp.]
MECHRLLKNIKKYPGSISFLIVALFLTVSFAVIGVKPFGNRLILLGDSYNQYLPFFGLYKDKALSGSNVLNDLFYTWKVGLGANYLLLFLYYLASPFNIILLLISKSSIESAFTFIIILKIAFSAASFSYYLSQRTSGWCKNAVIVALSVGYSLSGFVCGYFWNIMWLDSLIMFPIVLVGLERLLRDNKPFMYIWTLSLTMYLNFYMAFMICIFLGIYVLFWKYNSLKEFWEKFITFAAGSVLAAGMTALSLFVTYFGISSTSTADFPRPAFGFFGNVFSMFKNAFFLTKPVVTERYNGAANIYAGSALFLLCFLYFLSSKITRRDKLRHLGILFILVISMNERVLNYIWHGFHEQFLIPNRFSFILIFLVLSMAFDVISTFNDKESGFDENRDRFVRLVLAEILTILFMCICFFMVDLDSKINSTTVIFINIILSFVYSAVIQSGAIKKKISKISVIIFSVLFIAEIFANSFYIFNESSFTKDEADLNAMINYFEDRDDQHSAQFYREEILNPSITNENSFLGLNSASTFCSTIYGDSVFVMMDMGFSYLNNEFIYQGYTPFTSSILGVKNHYFTYENQVHQEENTNALSLGFAVNSDILSYKPKEEINPPANLNSMASLMLGEDVELMKDVNAGVIYDYDNCNIREGVESSNSVLIQPVTKSTASFIMEYDTEEKGLYYIYLAATDADNVTVLLDGQQYINGKITNGWLALPELEKGVTVDVVFETSVETSLVWYFSRYDSEKAEEILDELKEKNMNITEMGEGSLSADVTVEEGEVLFTTIPYDKGWKVYDGNERVETVRALRGFTAIKLSPGQHSLRFEYIPEGLVTGLLVMIASWIVFIVLYRRSKGKSKGESAESVASEVQNGE